jgi:cytosine/creatinine deaminase
MSATQVMSLSEQDKKFLAVAISEAQAGLDEGGIPIGASLVSKDGKLIAQGRNMRIQKYRPLRPRPEVIG